MNDELFSERGKREAVVHHRSGALATQSAKPAKECVTVNAIALGLFPSKMTALMMLGGDSSALDQLVPLGRTGCKADLDGSVVDLASEAGACVAGAALQVDGGSVL